MNYYDIHTHHQPSSGTKAILNLMNPDQAALALEQEGAYSVGIHPWHIHPDHWQDDVEILRGLIHHSRVKAIGEAGLDRLADLPLAVQQDVFEAMVALSEEARKPLIIHAVRTHAEIVHLHRQLHPKQLWIVHGFNLRSSIAEALLSRHIYLSFGEALLHHHSPAGEALKICPQELFFLETDDKQANMRDIYQRAASLRDENMEEMAERLEQRFKLVFGYA